MRLAKALENKQMDVRLIDKMLYDGKIDQSMLKEHLQALPDDSKSATTTGEAEKRD